RYRRCRRRRGLERASGAGLCARGRGFLARTTGGGLGLGLGLGLRLRLALGLRLGAPVGRAFLAAAATTTVVGHVPPGPLQLETGLRDEPLDLPVAAGTTRERRVGDALHLLEIAALLAVVLV